LHYSGGSDPVRHLGLLSRFPITGTATVEESTFRIDGTEYRFNRGVLDATVEARGKSYRFLGVHLKSKREVEDGDQELMRQGEARLLRKHVDSIFEADADARLVVYGDFNDTRPSPSFRTVTGRRFQRRIRVGMLGRIIGIRMTFTRGLIL
jgi:endonuclease/exonuclease/phosphatase family metal-dependent hydrolase